VLSYRGWWNERAVGGESVTVSLRRSDREITNAFQTELWLRRMRSCWDAEDHPYGWAVIQIFKYIVISTIEKYCLAFVREEMVLNSY